MVPDLGARPMAHQPVHTAPAPMAHQPVHMAPAPMAHHPECPLAWEVQAPDRCPGLLQLAVRPLVAAVVLADWVVWEAGKLASWDRKETDISI